MESISVSKVKLVKYFLEILHICQMFAKTLKCQLKHFIMLLRWHWATENVSSVFHFGYLNFTLKTQFFFHLANSFFFFQVHDCRSWYRTPWTHFKGGPSSYRPIFQVRVGMSALPQKSWRKLPMFRLPVSALQFRMRKEHFARGWVQIFPRKWSPIEKKILRN